MRIPEDRISQFYENAIELLTEFSRFVAGKLLEENGYSNSEKIEAAKFCVLSHLHKFKTAYKRQKFVESFPSYVKPREIAIGTHFEMKRLKNQNISIPKLLQSRGYYIPITETVRVLFDNQHFRDVYMQFNSSNSIEREHMCAEGVYCGFCCGKTFKGNALYQEHPNSLQIRIGTDDFGVSNPLGPKATVHKLTAVYFTIQNFPTELLSKIENIHVVALIHADDLKTKETDFNDIWRLVVRDIGYLEEFGVKIGENNIIKGTLSHFNSDNLGLNTSLGLAEGFQANNYCRICKLFKSECQIRCREDISEYRTLQDYSKHLEIIGNSTKVNLSDSCGVKRYCVLNDLAYFNMFNNASVDIMHDLNEGAILFVLHNFFTLITTSKLLTEKSLVQKIQYYDYGVLNSKITPAVVMLSKPNLNQTAAQVMCLFRHIPFILFELRNNIALKDGWRCIQSLLKIVQIAYSMRITEKNVIELEDQVALHLDLIQKTFKVNLIPKHHFMTHYGTIIRMMGPLIFLSMMRFEAMHQRLKRLIETSRNFMNITKTITKKYQAQSVLNVNWFTSDTQCGSKTPFARIASTCDEAELTFISKYFPSQNDLFVVKWFSINSFTYRKDLFVIFEKKIYQIQNLYVYENEMYIACTEWFYSSFDDFLNSLQVIKSDVNEKTMIKVANLKHKQSFEYKKVDSEFYIIAETLIVDEIMCQS